jgi:hypothetical protein
MAECFGKARTFRGVAISLVLSNAFACPAFWAELLVVVAIVQILLWIEA